MPPASSQYWLQYLLPSRATQRHAGCAHLSFFSVTIATSTVSTNPDRPNAQLPETVLHLDFQLMLVGLQQLLTGGGWQTVQERGENGVGCIPTRASPAAG
jgi:hypothetical protein